MRTGLKLAATARVEPATNSDDRWPKTRVGRIPPAEYEENHYQQQGSDLKVETHTIEPSSDQGRFTVPVSTVYYWARTGVIVPSVLPERPKRWSYADLIGLRIVYWLRHPKSNESEPVLASPMNDVRRALTELDHLELDIWSSSYDGPRTPLRVDRSGKVYVDTGPMVETTHREGVLDETLDLIGPFEAGFCLEGLAPCRQGLRIQLLPVRHRWMPTRQSVGSRCGDKSQARED